MPVGLNTKAVTQVARAAATKVNQKVAQLSEKKVGTVFCLFGGDAATGVAEKVAQAAEKKIESAGVLFVGGAAAGAATKGVGSAFRIVDDSNAPSDVRKNTIQRESLTVALTSGCAGAVKVVFSNLLEYLKNHTQGKVRETAEKLLGQKGVITVALVAAGSIIAEVVGRKVAPRNLWTKDGQLNTGEMKSGNHASSEINHSKPPLLTFAQSANLENNPFEQLPRLSMGFY